MDDEITLLAVPVGDPVATPRDEPPQSPAERPATLLPFPDRADPLLLRGYESPGAEFHPRLWSNEAA